MLCPASAEPKTKGAWEPVGTALEADHVLTLGELAMSSPVEGVFGFDERNRSSIKIDITAGLNINSYLYLEVTVMTSYGGSVLYPRPAPTPQPTEQLPQNATNSSNVGPRRAVLEHAPGISAAPAGFSAKGREDSSSRDQQHGAHGAHGERHERGAQEDVDLDGRAVPLVEPKDSARYETGKDGGRRPEGQSAWAQAVAMLQHPRSILDPRTILVSQPRGRDFFLYYIEPDPDAAPDDMRLWQGVNAGKLGHNTRNTLRGGWQDHDGVCVFVCVFVCVCVCVCVCVYVYIYMYI
jgi:hypothetical protein